MAKKNSKPDSKNSASVKSLTTPHFFHFVFKQKQNRNEFFIFTFLYALVYLLFQLCYPSPYTTGDSANYVLCAINQDFGGYRPYGYSAFMRAVAVISNNVNFFTLVQFAFHYVSFLFFLFTVKYFFPVVKKQLFWLLVFFTLFNEGIIYLSKWIMSDSLFISLSVFWFATLIWLIQNRNNWFMLVLHFIILYILMKIRYTGLIYPIISTIIFAYIYRFKSWHIVGINLFLFFAIYKQGVNDNERLVEIETFSGFSGWAQANNATAILPYVEIDSTKIKDPEVRRINSICIRFNDSVYDMEKVNATAFMWYKGYPGKTVMTDVYARHNGQWGYVKCWIYTGTILNKYASFLIKTHPWEFFRRFVLWNAAQLFVPLIDYGNYPITKVDDKTKEWFGIEYPRYFAKFDFFYTYLMDYNYAKYILSWALALVAFIFYLVKRKQLQFSELQQKIISALFIFVFLTAAFLIISHPIHYRYVIMFSVFYFFFIFIIANQLIQNKLNAHHA